MDGGGQAKVWAGGGSKSAAPLTASSLERRLNLRRRAREDGARNDPGPQAQDLSATEREIMALAAAERARLDSERTDIRVEIEKRLRTLAPSPQDFTGPALEARLALKQAAGRLAQDWAETASLNRAARDNLERFRRMNALHRLAHYPRSTLLQAGLLLCAALFEAMFSAALFAEDDARGLLGGAITAIGLSGANVTLGFLAGFLGLRYLQHVRPPVKLMGGAAFAFFGALALMLNLFAANWRDHLALASGAGGAADPADASFHIWSLLQLQTPQAIILLMLGAGVWVFATLKGYSGFDDPYPDYGKMDRAARESAQTLSEFRSEARLDLEEPIDAAGAQLSARLEKVRAEFEAMQRAFDAAAQRMQALDARAHALDDAAAAAIRLYRNENAYVRTTPPPAYFGDTPPASGAPVDALSGAAALIDAARGLLEQAQTQAGEARQGLLSELDAAAERLERPNFA